MPKLTILTSFCLQTILAFVQAPQKPLLKEYDFIIIGSGSAGCALANRLSEISHWRILLLEAGRRPGLLNDIPAAAQVLAATDYNWNYKMEQNPGACLGVENQKCTLARGRGLGGTTLINYMIYSRGDRSDYDRWAAEGNPGWSYNDVLPYFLKSEASTVRTQDEGYHNHSGVWNVEDIDFRPVILESFIDAGRELGYPLVDYNGRSQIGFSYVQANTKNGIRQSGYRTFIQPIEHRENLDISTETRVVKILIKESTAHGVLLVRNGRYYKIFARKEVVLSAGTFNSPQVLMLSGVGPREHLKSLGIEVVKDAPVGKNLRDHMIFLGMTFTVNSSVTGGPFLREDPKSFLQWLLTGTGALSDIGVGGLAFLNTNLTSDLPGVPDVEIVFSTGKMTPIARYIFQKTAGLSQEAFDIFWKYLSGKDFCLIFPAILNPRSVGHLELQTKDPFTPPRFFGNYLSDPGNLDVKTFIEAIKIIKKLVNTSSFRRYGIQRHDIVLPACKGFTVDSDEYWECNIRHLAVSEYHQTGTCKMGPKSDPTSVVDHSGQVYGVGNLRVADCSIIPFPLTGHTNAPAFMIGEKISDEIKNRWTPERLYNSQK